MPNRRRSPGGCKTNPGRKSAARGVIGENSRGRFIGAAPGELRVPVFGLLEGQKSIGGSAIGSNAEMRAMLEFAAAHAVQPMIESYSMSAINDVLQRLRENRVRYRAVLVNDGNFRS
jgi:alcohol/geraniol dehydrogenase (NADP+)